MRNHGKPLSLLRLSTFALGLLAGGCTGVSLPSFSSSSQAPPPPASAITPSKYNAEEIVGRWGFTSYQREGDRARTIAGARNQCRHPYVIAKGPTGGVMMHLADQRQASEVHLKGSPEGKEYIGPEGEPGGGAQDREILSFDGRVLITRYVDPDAANRYGNMVYVRCGPRA
jgi:hypothetical protein